MALAKPARLFSRAPSAALAQPASGESLAKALYEEWLSRKRRDLEAEIKSASVGCQAFGCLSPLILAVPLVLGSFMRNEGAATVMVLLVGGVLLATVLGLKQQKDRRVAELVDRYENEATVKRRELGIVGQLMRVVGIREGQFLPMREQPDTQSRITGQIPRVANEVLWRGETKSVNGDEWHHVEFGGRQGWAKGSYLRFQ